MKKTQKIIYYILLVLMSMGFIAAGIPKVMGDPMAVAGFAQMHLPVWFVYFIGAAEILGAIGLWIKRLSAYATYGLWTIMLGAVVTILSFSDSKSVVIVPIVYSIILGIIFWLNKKR